MHAQLNASITLLVCQRVSELPNGYRSAREKDNVMIRSTGTNIENLCTIISSSGQQLDVWSSHRSVGSLMDISMGLWLDPVCHEGDWDGTRPWPCAVRTRPLPRARRRAEGARRGVAV